MPVSTERIEEVKIAYENELMRKANVVGVGIGYRYRDGNRTDEVVIVVMVERKLTLDALSESDIIPAEIDGIPVDVQVVGWLQAGQ